MNAQKIQGFRVIITNPYLLKFNAQKIFKIKIEQDISLYPTINTDHFSNQYLLLFINLHQKKK
jgi:hypothetical protein